MTIRSRALNPTSLLLLAGCFFLAAFAVSYLGAAAWSSEANSVLGVIGMVILVAVVFNPKRSR